MTDPREQLAVKWLRLRLSLSPRDGREPQAHELAAPRGITQRAAAPAMINLERPLSLARRSRGRGE
jgi:hypothetical protein